MQPAFFWALLTVRVKDVRREILGFADVSGEAEACATSFGACAVVGLPFYSGEI